MLACNERANTKKATDRAGAFSIYTDYRPHGGVRAAFPGSGRVYFST